MVVTDLACRPHLHHWLSSATTDHELATTVAAIASSAVELRQLIERAPLDGLLGSAGSINVQGEAQKPLDVLANDLFVRSLSACACVSIMITEEEAQPILVDGARGSLVVAFDPLDGSSNLDCSIPVGSIFGIWRSVPEQDGGARSALAGRNLLAAGYCLYSSACHLVLTLGQQTHGFTLNSARGEFVLTHPSICCPCQGAYYSLNEGREADWPDGLRRYIQDVKNGRGTSGNRYSSRYVCSLVADVHRTLLYGGWAGNPRAHLRLLYEAAPIAFLVEQAGGSATDGSKPILDVAVPLLSIADQAGPPEFPASSGRVDLRSLDVHARTPLFAGSAEDIAELHAYGDVAQLGSFRYEV